MLLLLLALGCKATADDPLPEGASTVQLTTRDDVTLVADLYPASTTERPGVVLLHMTPRGPWNRTDWPTDFIEKLHAHDWAVIAVDRRGAGDSGGEADDAFEGEKGKYDVEACVLKLNENSLGALAVIGASNGTTSMIDYAVWAGGEGLPEVAAMGFMTGGTYTENQTGISDVPKVPAIFTYSTEERDWSVAQQPLDPGTWSFREYPDGAHGTQMFEAKPEVADHLDAFFAGVL
jgi:pimeloyl-ACP methyl ester carboxylesterase